MDTLQPFYAYLHWFWVALFALLGLFTLWKPRWAGVTPCNSSNWLRLRDAQQQQRALDALERRAEMEQPSPVPGYLCGFISLALAAVAAFTPVPVGLLYALLCLCLALVSALVFIQLRNAQPRRVAILAPRDPVSVIPVWLFGLAAVSASSVLVFASVPQYSLSSFIVCCSAFVAAVIARRLAQLPAMLQGIDLAAEEFVDARLRLYRSSTVLYLSVVQPFVYCSQTMQHKSVFEAAVQLFTAALMATYVIWWLRKIYKTSSFSLA